MSVLQFYRQMTNRRLLHTSNSSSPASFVSASKVISSFLHVDLDRPASHVPRRTHCARCVSTSNRFFKSFPKVFAAVFRCASTQKSSPWHNPLRLPSGLQKERKSTQLELSWSRPSTLVTKCLARRCVSHSVHPSTESGHLARLLVPIRSITCRSTCGHHRTNALLTHPTLPARSVHRRGLWSSCPVIIVDTSIFNPSDGGMGEKTCSGPKC